MTAPDATLAPDDAKILSTMNFCSVRSAIRLVMRPGCLSAVSTVSLPPEMVGAPSGYATGAGEVIVVTAFQ